MENNTTKSSALIASSVGSFLTPFMGSSVNIAMPAIGHEFQIDAVLLSWVSTVYLLSAAIALVPFGRLSDIYGRKKVLTWGMAVFTVASLMIAYAPSITALILFRIIQGIGSGMIFSTGIAIITSVYPQGERGRALGITVATVYAGLSLGPMAGGFLTEHFTWRSIFFVVTPLGFVTIAFILMNLKGEWAEAAGEPFDGIGTILYSLSVIALMFGITETPSIRTLWLLITGILGLTGFVLWEMRVPYPVLELRLFTTNRTFALSSITALINYSATFAVIFLVSLYLQYIKSLSPQQAGLVIMAQPVIMALCSPFAGRLSDKIEPRVVASAGMAITSAALACLALMHKRSSLILITGDLALLGLGIAFFSSPNTNAIMSSVEKKFYGIASGAVGTMRLLGQMTSMGIVTLLFSLFIGKARITPDYYPQFFRSMKAAFVIFALLCCAGIFTSLARGKVTIDISETIPPE